MKMLGLLLEPILSSMVWFLSRYHHSIVSLKWMFKK